MKLRPALLALLLTLPASVGTTAATPPPPAAVSLVRDVTVTAHGSRGMVIELPTDATFPEGSVQLALSDGATLGFVAIRPETCPEHPGSRTCISHRFFLHPEDMTGLVHSVPDPSTLPAGRYELYLVSDGTLTATFHLDELPAGHRSFTATGVVDATVARLPGSCAAPRTDCDTFGYGGRAERINGDYGYVLVAAYSRRPGFVGDTPMANPGSSPVEACTYPALTYPEASADPEDHPYGCDYVFNGQSLIHDLNNTQGFLLRAVQPTVSMWGRYPGTEVSPHDDTPAGNADVYAGFTAGGLSPLEPPVNYAATGMWLTLGIDCDATCAR